MKSDLACRLSIVAFLALGIAGACSKESDKPEYHNFDGRITGVDRNSGAVEFEFFSKKHQEMRKRTGKLAPEAEILINGATARMEDVHIGDQAVVTGRIDEDGDEKLFVATRVNVTRSRDAKSSDSKPASGAAHSN